MVQGILARQEEDAIQDAKDDDCDSLEDTDCLSGEGMTCIVDYVDNTLKNPIVIPEETPKTKVTLLVFMGIFKAKQQNEEAIVREKGS